MARSSSEGTVEGAAEAVFKGDGAADLAPGSVAGLPRTPRATGRRDFPPGFMKTNTATATPAASSRPATVSTTGDVQRLRFATRGAPARGAGVGRVGFTTGRAVAPGGRGAGEPGADDRDAA